MNDLPENELAVRAGLGDRDAADALVSRFERRNQSFAKYVTTEDRYDEVVQAARIATWEASATFDPHRGAKFSSYAYQMRTLRGLQAAKAQRLCEYIDVPPGDLEAEAIARDTVKRMRRIVRNCVEFDTKDKRIFFERIIGGRTCVQMGRLLGLDKSTISARERRIRALLPSLFASLR